MTKVYKRKSGKNVQEEFFELTMRVPPF